MSCLAKHGSEHLHCRDGARAYLECRMDRYVLNFTNALKLHNLFQRVNGKREIDQTWLQRNIKLKSHVTNVCACVYVYSSMVITKKVCHRPTVGDEFLGYSSVSGELTEK